MHTLNKFQLSIIILETIIGTLCTNVNRRVWEYNDPNLWPYIESLGTCGSNRQSPINIENERIECNSILLKPLVFFDYDTIKMNFSYNGKAINSYPTNKTTASIKGSGLPPSLQPFEFIQFHFHWGSTSENGSEHLVNGKRYPLELHFVHESKASSDYYAVVGVLFEIQNESNPILDEIIASVDHLSNNVGQSKISLINLRSLLPENIEKFYFYEGSLTTPPCTESVFWTVMDSKIGISEAQMASFRTNILAPNIRPPQPINSRLVLSNFCDFEINKASIKKNDLRYVIIICIIDLLSMIFFTL